MQAVVTESTDLRHDADPRHATLGPGHVLALTGKIVAAARVTGLTLRPLRRTGYHVLAEQGLLDDERVELLEGALVRIGRQSGRHAVVAPEPARHLIRHLPDE